jgi:hypothetical protein
MGVEPVLAGLTLIDLAVVGAVAVVLPASLGGRWRWWAIAAVSAFVACAQDRGSVGAVVLALPWPVVGASVALLAIQDAGPLFFWTRLSGTRVLGALYAVAASAWFVISRAGAEPMGIHEPIVELTAVHFSYAGAGALVLAGAAWTAAATPHTQRVGRLAVGLTAGAPPIIAAGFVTGAAVPQVGGAVLLSLGVFCTAALHLHRAFTISGRVGERALLALSGAAVWAPMVLAVAWAAGQHWDVPVLSIHDMARTHGAGNALGFVGAGLLALHIERRSTEANTWS